MTNSMSNMVTTLRHIKWHKNLGIVVAELLIDAQARVLRGCFCPAYRRDSEDEFKSDAQNKVAPIRKYDNINWRDARRLAARKMQSDGLQI